MSLARATVAPVWLRFSVPIAALAMTGSVIGIVQQDSVYGRETANWAGQAVGQDIANLIAFTALLVLAYLARRGSLRAYLAWAGVLGYSVYTYAMYVFDVHFGPLFLLWVAVFGLSIYALIGALAALDPAQVRVRFGDRAPVRSTSVVLIVVGVLFALLWLSEIVPSMLAGTTPDSLVVSGLPTSPVHVLDLAVLLPAAVAAGLLLRRGGSWGYVLAPVVLLTMVFIAVGIVSLMVVLGTRGMGSDPVIGVVIGVVAVIEAVVAARFLRAIEPGGSLAGVLRPPSGA